METNLMSSVNFGCVCFFFTAIVAGLTIFFKLRWQIKVNCWFCNSSTHIWRREVGWWLCLSCSQYNGFTKDGDYNHSIPEQSKENESSNYCTLIKRKLTDYQNGLCENCNDNEEYKLTELRRLENSRDIISDKDFSKYKLSYEKKYPLCEKCSDTVKRSLYKQTLWLAEYRLLSMQKSIKNIVNNKKKMENLFRIFLICSNLSMYFGLFLWPCIVSGTFFQLIITLTVKQKNNILSNVLLTLLWINIAVLTMLPEVNLLHANLYFSKLFQENITTKNMVALLQLIIVFELLFIKPKLSAFNGNISFKKIESVKKNLVFEEINSDSSSEKDSSIINEKFLNFCPSPVNITNTLSSKTLLEMPIPIKAENLQKEISSERLLISPNYLEKERKSIFYSPVSCSDDINQSVKSLSSLSLNEIPYGSSTKSSSVFLHKVYGTVSADLFQKPQNRKLVLAPSKLRISSPSFSTRNNFWQDELELSTLSRSSSQSSGFISHNGDPFCKNSVFDTDRYSMMSDTTICIHQRCNCDSPAFFSKSRRKHKKKKNVSRCKYYPVKYDNSANNSKENTTLTTAYTSSSWLPVLLCGSLIFNVAVLCVVLIR